MTTTLRIAGYSTYPDLTVDYPCGLCGFEVHDDDLALECDDCQHWIHISCNKTTKNNYKKYQEDNNDEEFICKQCKQCKICNKTLAKNHLALKCNVCKRKVHTSCNKLDKKDYTRINTTLENDNLFTCLPCIAEAIPLSNLNNKQLELISQGLDPPEEVDINHMSLDERQQNAIRRINELMDVQDDDDEMSPVNCKYYSIDQFKKKKFDPQKHFSILHLNIHSLERHIDELRLALSLMDHNFDFICITETKIKKNMAPKFDISLEGYQDPVGTPTEAGKGGVLIYIKQGIDYKPREELNIYKSKELESYFIETINSSGKNVIVGTIYRHPCMDPSLFTEEYIQPLLDTITSENKKVFIAGDFNFDLLKTEKKETFQFFETMMSSQLMPTITIPTKLNNKNNTVIDNIFINQIHPDTISGNFTIGISDHLLSFVTIPRDNQNHLPKKHNLYVRCRRNYKPNDFILDFLEIDWDEVLEAYRGDAHLTTKNFVDRFEILLDQHMPWRKITQKEFKKRIKPWINDEIIELIDKKYETFKKYMQCKDEERRKTLHEEYKQLKNAVTDITRKREKEHYDNYFTENKNNLQKIWKGINEVINVKAKTFTQPNCIMENNKPVTEPRKIANAFNNYFTSVADNILKKRKFEGHKSHRDYLQNQNPHTFK